MLMPNKAMKLILQHIHPINLKFIKFFRIYNLKTKTKEEKNVFFISSSCLPKEELKALIVDHLMSLCLFLVVFQWALIQSFDK